MLKPLHEFMEVHAVEPEEKAALQLQNVVNRFRKYRVHQLAIADHTGKGELLVTAHPSMSSLLEPDFNEFARDFGAVRNAGDWKKTMNVVSRQNVITNTFYDFYANNITGFIDFLKIDTQGNELEILKSGEALIREHKIGVLCVEVGLFSVYKGQCLFSDVDLFMRERGYRLVEFKTYPETRAREDEFSAGRKIYERPRTSPVGDAWYVADDLTDTDLRARCAVILAAEGYLSEAVHLLNGILNANEQHEMFRELMKLTGMSRLKHFLKRWVPLAIQQWNAKRKKG